MTIRQAKLSLLAFLWFFSGYAPALYAEETLWRTQAEDGTAEVHLYFFWTPTCPHCKKARLFIEPLPEQYPWLRLHSSSIIGSRENAVRYHQMAKALGEKAKSVPGFFICGEMFVGWDSAEGTGQLLMQALERCRTGSGPLQVEEKQGQEQKGGVAQVQSLHIPLLGEMAADEFSLPVFTLIIAGLDAFNPCAFFVLLFLLSLLVHARSRARMLLIGGSFVLVSGVVYFVFMAAWLNLFLLVGGATWMTLAAGGIAVLIGLINIKDYFRFHQGPSLSIPDATKPGLFSRMRPLLSSDNLFTLMVGTVALAVAVNSYELLCTAGFPMVYTRTLTLHNLSEAEYYLYLVLYNVIYVIPLMVIVVLFTISLGARKLTVNEGRLLKLMSGVMMLGLGLVLLIEPAWLNNIFAGIGLLLLAICVVLLARLRQP